MAAKRILAVLPLPRDALGHLRAVVDPLRATAPDVPWTDPGTWHVRLAHFGNLEGPKIEAVEQAMTELTSYCEPLRLRLSGSVVSPGTGPAETLGVVVEGDVADLTTLANAIPDFVGRGHQLYIDRRAFRPVVVLARAKRAAFDAEAARAVLDRYEGPVWTADHLRVVHHTYRADEGDRYAEVRTHPLTSGRPGAQ